MNRRHWILRGMAVLGGAGALPARAATAPEHEGPWRTSRDGSVDRLMLEGHDAVAYFSRDTALPGVEAFALDWAGVHWRFASAAHRDTFAADPWRHAPQFGGFCTNGIDYAIPWGGGGGPNTWRVYRGRLYVFGGRSARDHFEMDTELNLERAHHYWDTEVRGTHALWQRWKRLAWRVPHYRSDADLQAEWEARRVAGTLPVMPGAAQVVPR